MDSLNSIETPLDIATSIAPFIGTRVMTSGSLVSTVRSKMEEFPEVLPVTSVAVAVMVWLPSAKVVLV